MIILHSSFYTPQSSPEMTMGSCFWIWGESSNSLKDDGIAFPYDAGKAELNKALKEIDAGVRPGPATTLCLQAPSLYKDKHLTPCPSNPIIAEIPESNQEIILASWKLTAVPVSYRDFITILSYVNEDSLLATGIAAGDDLRFWKHLVRFTYSLITRQKYIPSVGLADNHYQARWKPVVIGQDRDILVQISQAMPQSCRALFGSDDEGKNPMSPIAMIEAATAILLDRLVREDAQVNAPVRALSSWDAYREKRTKGTDITPVHDRWLSALTSSDPVIDGDKKELDELYVQYRDWIRPLSMSINAPFRLCFRLCEPEEITSSQPFPWKGEGAEPPPGPPQENTSLPHRNGGSFSPNRIDEEIKPPPNPLLAKVGEEEWHVEYLLQARDDPSLMIRADKAWNPKGRTATLLQRDNFRPNEFLLSSLGHASRIAPEIEQSMRKPSPTGYSLNTDGAFAFLTEEAWLLEESGYAVQLPVWWTRRGARKRLSSRANIKTPSMKTKAGLSLDTIIEVQWEIALGDTVITREELEALAMQKTGLVRIRGQWVQIDPDEIEAVLRHLKKVKSDKISARDAIRLALGGGEGPNGLPVDGIDATGWMRDFLEDLNNDGALEMQPCPENLQATLRPYQERGYSWLTFLRQWGLGACLADDMGLGKTIQVLAHISHQRSVGEERPVLVVCPTSVVGNWEREANRFAPDLSVMVHHGGKRIKDDKFVEMANKHAIVLSSYALLHRDIEQLQAVDWAEIILDEAQNIKNPETKQAKAVRTLKTDGRIALTGTPVENHVGDLWSIMEFLNPGFLGTQAEFKRTYFYPIQTGDNANETKDKLKKLTGPFILRRLKSDKSIIADLPDKLEMDVFCTLTKEQASLYRAVVKDAEESIEKSDGIQRKGMVLATLGRLKQICNHPAQYLGDNSSIPDRSGKLARLSEMLEEVVSVGECALIFTQYYEMGEIIRKYLQETFAREALFLHGGVMKEHRDRMVRRFQSDNGPSFFILSLKAGGTGLTLTRANHVFHYDRWWNPAVENQATDRAYRIGQTKQVQVHKFICSGTLEDKINAMIERKKSLAESIVGAGENWLTELSTTELKELFRLRET